MKPENYEFLRAMEETPSVSGFEQPVARIVRKRMAKFADKIQTDVHGNVMAVLNPNAEKRVMLAGHMDQIGLMVTHVLDDGYVQFAAVGGIDATVLPGSRVTIHAKDGPIEGVIGRKPIHLMKESERNSGKVELESLWIDIGIMKKAEVMELVAIGDPITYKLGMMRVGKDFITSPALDNKVGTYVVMEALRIASTMKIKCALYAVATVQEEIGLRGAVTSTFGIEPHVGIAADVWHATDNPGAEKRTSGDNGLGKGPVIFRGPNINPVVHDLLMKTAKEKKIPYQVAAAPRATGTDGNTMQISRAGVAVGIIGIPNRYMHTPVEMCSLADLDACANLIAQTVAKIDSKSSFIPE